MNKLFDLDSPVMRFLSMLTDLMILNIVTILCCIPVITAGAAFTALHYVLLKMVRNEEGYIVRSYFKSFKENFKQATIIWIIIMIFILLFIGDVLIFNYSQIQFPKAIIVLVLGLVVIAAMMICYVFPILSRFENTVFQTIKNSLLMAILSFPKTILMLILYVIPVAAFWYVPMAVPLVFLFGISGPAFCSAMLYSKTFKRFEPEEISATDMEYDVTEKQGEDNER